MATKLTNLHPSIEERTAAGKALRDRVSRKSQGKWKPAANRPDPIELLKRADEGRLPELLPIRYGRMSQSPFAFFRGAAALMAFDLSKTPATGLRVQACGDCHIAISEASARPNAGSFLTLTISTRRPGSMGVGRKAARDKRGSCCKAK